MAWFRKAKKPLKIDRRIKQRSTRPGGRRFTDNKRGALGAALKEVKDFVER